MAMFLLFNVLVAIVAFIGYRSISTFISNRRFEAFAKQHGCQPAVEISTGLFDDLQRLKRIVRMKQSGEDLLDDIFGQDLGKESHTLQRKVIGGTEVIETIEPANIQAMLATQFKDYLHGARRIAMLWPILGHSIFSSDGAFWAHSRALFRPQFSRENINDLESTETATVALERAIGSVNLDGWTNEVDVLPLFFHFTLDTATDFLFGESVNSQTAAMEKHSDGSSGQHEENVGHKFTSDNFAESFQIAGEVLIWRIRLQRLYFLADGLKFRRAARNMRSYADHFVQLALKSNQNSEKSTNKKFNLLSALVEQTKDREELQSQTLAIMFAGRDSTATFLGWAFVMLAMHPQVFKKLRAAIMNDFATDELITFAQLKSCRYLQNFMNEVLRLWPIVPVNNRVAAHDTTLPVGGGPDQKAPVAVRKGQVVVYSVYLMQRRKDLWGPDALEFRPERWDERKVPAWHFLPFNGGPRICLGQQFAITEASYVVVRMLQKFDGIEPARGTEMATGAKLTKRLSLTVSPAAGVKIRLHKA